MKSLHSEITDTGMVYIFDFSGSGGVVASDYIIQGEFQSLDMVAKTIQLHASYDGIHYDLLHDHTANGQSSILNVMYNVSNEKPFLFYRVKLTNWLVENMSDVKFSPKMVKIIMAFDCVRGIGEKILRRYVDSI